MGESESSLLGDAECTLLEDANMGWDRPTMRHGSGVDVLSHPQTCFLPLGRKPIVFPTRRVVFWYSFI